MTKEQRKIAQIKENRMMEKLQWGSHWRAIRRSEYEPYKLKHLNERGKWDLMITHYNLQFIREYLHYSHGVLSLNEL